MGRALLPQHDAGERELPPQGPPWRAGGPAMLRVLILALLWRGSLSQPPGFTLAVPQSVSVQEGLCVLVPCNFTYPASYDTNNPSAQLYVQWFKEPATVGQDPPVASSVPSVKLSQETQGRFRLTGDPAHGDCSLQISDARQTDAGTYFLNIEKGMLDHTYHPNSDGTAPVLTISVTDPTEPPNITGILTRNGRPELSRPPNTNGNLITNGNPASSGGLTPAFIEFSCKFIFVATGFFLAYYLTLLYYRWRPCCCHGSRRKDRRGAWESRVPESGV